MKRNLFYFFLWLLLLNSSDYFCKAQNTTKELTIKALVTDENEIPLIGATVIDSISLKKTITDKHGFFNITIPKNKIDLNISYVGFNSFRKTFDKNELEEQKSDTILLSIKLNPITINISEIEINSSEVQRAYNEKDISVIDFEFHPNGLFLLLSINNINYLRLVNEYDQTLHEKVLKNKPEKFFKDCFNNIQLVCADSIFQLVYSEKDFSFLGGYSIKNFKSLLEPCVAANQEFLYFKEYGLHNKSIQYYSVNLKTKEKKIINNISDDASFIATDNFYRRNQAEQIAFGNTITENTIEQQKAARKAQKDFWFYQQILSSPVYYPMIQIKDSLFVFNHLADSALVYNDKGKICRRFTINHHLKNGWKNDIIKDYSSAELYAKYIRGGLVYLSKINTNNGTSSNEVLVKAHIYPEKIKIRDGYVYYIFNNTKDQSKPNVYRQKIKI